MGITKQQLLNTVSQIKNYVDSKDILISNEEGNRIIIKDDGIYVASENIITNEEIGVITDSIQKGYLLK